MKLAHGGNSLWSSQSFTRLSGFHSVETTPPPAATRCPFCQRTVSDNASTCSHCGTMLQELDDDQHGKGFWALAVTCLTFALIFCLAVMR